jgi:hypothetical protein
MQSFRFRQPPGAKPGATHRYVERNRGVSDLATLSQPPTLLPFAQEDSGARYALSRGSYYNYLRNSGFWSTQVRSLNSTAGLGFTIPVNERVLTYDGWSMCSSDNGVNQTFLEGLVSRQPLYRSPYYWGAFGIDGGGRAMVSQVIEAQDVFALRGRIVRAQAVVAFCAQSSAITTPFARVRIALAKLSGGTTDVIPTTFMTGFANSGTVPILGANLSFIPPLTYGADGGVAEVSSIVGTGFGPRNGISTASATVNSRTGVSFFPAFPRGQRLGGLWQIPSDAQNLIFMIWNDQNMNSSSLATFLAVSQPSLTVGEAIQEWRCLSMAAEIARSQRFLSSSFSPTSPTGAGARQLAGLAGSVRGYVNAGGTASGQILPIRFPVEMRAAPTITLYNPSAANAFVRNTQEATDATASATANIGTTGADVTFTGRGGGGSWDIGDPVAVHYLANAEI